MADSTVVDEIKNKVDIVELVSEYVPLTQKGRNYFGVCPFHDDHSPSMSVSKDKQIYTCFSCGATGNVFKFLMDYKHIDFKEALHQLGDRAGVKVVGSRPTKIDTNKKLYDIYDYATKIYQNNLFTSFGKEAKEYLNKRGINDEVIKEFQIGLALKEKDYLSKIVIKKGFNPKDAVNIGLLRENSYGYSDLYINRIMFPLSNNKGDIVGFNGRVYKKRDENAKYINTRETIIFKKGKLLYNYSKAERETRIQKKLIIVEGHIDAIRLWSIGVKNVVATQGTAFTKEQAELAMKLSKNIILCFDGDDAGSKATMAASNELIKLGANVKIIRLDERLDPDEFILKYKKERFINVLNNPMNVMDFKLLYYKEGLDFENSEDLSKYINLVLNELQNLNDDIMRELILKKISEDLKFPLDILKSKLKDNSPKVKTIINEQAPPMNTENMPVPPEDLTLYDFEEVKTPKRDFKKKQSTPSIVKNHPKIKYNKFQKAEQRICFHMLFHKEARKLYENEVSYLPTPKYRYLACEIIHFDKGNFNLAEFKHSIDSKKELMDAVLELESLNINENYLQEEMDDYIYMIKVYSTELEKKRLTEKLKRQKDPYEKAIIAQQIAKLRKKENE